MLGSGNFGSVLLGTYSLPRTRKRVQVAVKMLKVDDVPNQRVSAAGTRTLFLMPVLIL